MVGPRNTPYEGGLFEILIEFPTDYPNHGPEFRFKNKIYHLNVDPKNGLICIASLNSWRCSGQVRGREIYNIKHALIDIFCLFYENHPEGVFSSKMAEQYLNNPEQFYEEAKNWTKKYASP